MTQAHIVDRYVFDPNDGFVQLPDIVDLKIEGVQLVTNLTRGEVIYQFNNIAKGGQVIGDKLYFNLDVSGMGASDKLQIIYNPPWTGGFFEQALHLMRQAIDVLKWPSYVIQTGAGVPKAQVVLAVDSNLNSCGAVGYITTLNQFNGLDSRLLVWSTMELTYLNGVRSKIN